MESLLPGTLVSIRQMRDAYARDADFLAYGVATIDEQGRLDMTNSGIPAVKFYVITWKQKPYPRSLTIGDFPVDGFLQPWALKDFMLVGEDSHPVITIIEPYDLEQSQRRNRLMRAEENRLRDLQYWADFRKKIFTPVTWIREANKSHTIRKVDEEPPPYPQPESDSSLVVVRKSPMNPGQHNGIGGLRNETVSYIPKRRLVVGKVDKADTEEL